MTSTQRYNFSAENSIQPSNQRLSICLKAHGFSFSLVNSQNCICKIADYDMFFPERLSELMQLIRKVFADNGIHTFGFREIKIIFPVHKHTWIPSALFKPENTADYLRFVCHVENTESVNSLYSEALDAYSVFTLNQNLYSAFKIIMPSAVFQSQYPVLAKKTLELATEKGNTMLLNIRSNEIDISVCKNKQFIYSNTFSYNQQQELVYFALNVAKQLKLNNESLKCFVGGQADIGFLMSIRNFLPLASFVPPPVCVSKPEGKLDENVFSEYFLIL